MRIVEFVPYDPLWPEMFQNQAAPLRDAFGENLIDIHHIGSTSIPGMSAKPIIDIMAIVKDQTKNNHAAIEKLGLKRSVGLNMPFHIYFSNPQYHLHIWEEWNPIHEMHLRFRDYLRAHSNAMQEYNAFKKELSVKFRDDRRDYTKGKDRIIQSIIERTGFDKCILTRVYHEREWENYHRIAKTELFEPVNIEYDLNHPSFSDPNFHRFVYVKGATIVGIIMVELKRYKKAILRSIAVDLPYQKKGYGKEMLLLIEKWVKQQGTELLLLHARAGVEDFYKKLGYVEMSFVDGPQLQTPKTDMGKWL